MIEPNDLGAEAKSRWCEISPTGKLLHAVIKLMVSPSSRVETCRTFEQITITLGNYHILIGAKSRDLSNQVRFLVYGALFRRRYVSLSSVEF